MNRAMRRKAGTGRNLYQEVTGKRTVIKEIPVSKIKIDESKLDQQLLNKMMEFEKNKDSLQRDVGRFCGLTLRYLDSLCTLQIDKLDAEEKANAIGIIDLVVKNMQSTLEGLVLGDGVIEKVTDNLKNIAHYSLTCVEGTDIPMILPLCENTIQLIDYSYVIGAYIGGTMDEYKFAPKDIEYVKEYAEFLINKSLEIKSKN